VTGQGPKAAQSRQHALVAQPPGVKRPICAQFLAEAILLSLAGLLPATRAARLSPTEALLTV